MLLCKTALVLCGGKGSRFREVSASPKILAQVGEGVFLEWILNYLNDNGFEKVVLSTGYKASEIVSYIEKNEHKFSIGIDYCFEDHPLGTGGAVINFFENFANKEVYVFNGDTYWPNQIPRDLFKSDLDKALCLTSKVEKNDRYGDYKIIDKKLEVKLGTASDVIEESNVYVGIARVSSNILNHTPDIPCSLEELLSFQPTGIDLLIGEMKFLDFGTVEAYPVLNKSFDV